MYILSQNHDFVQQINWLILHVWFEGAIELSILADYYAHEIAAYDIQNTRCDLYGQVGSNLASSVHQILVSSALLILFCWLTGKELFWKSIAYLRWASLWCFSCMIYCYQFLVIIFILFALLIRSENFRKSHISNLHMRNKIHPESSTFMSLPLSLMFPLHISMEEK